MYSVGMIHLIKTDTLIIQLIKKQIIQLIKKRIFSYI